MVALISCKYCIMYADTCKIEPFACACVLHMIVYLCRRDLCIILCLSGMCGSAASLLRWPLVRLELHELFCYVVVVALREDAQHRQARLVHVDAPAQREPAGDAALAGDVLHLQHGHAHGAVLSGKTVVLHTHLQLVAFWTHLGTEGAGRWRGIQMPQSKYATMLDVSR